MLLKELQLRNFCQHESLTLKFQPGVVGIFGANGSGKSNLLSALKISLCNDYSTNNGSKNLLIRRGAGAKAVSRVTSVWSHEGQEFEICRGLRPTEHSLSLGSKTYVGAEDVQQQLDALLGCDLGVIGRYLFVDQWRMFAFMEQQAAARVKAFAQLCRLDHAEKIWQLLGKEEAALEAQSEDDLRPLIKELQAQVNLKVAKHNQLLAEDKQRRESLLSAEQQQGLRQVLTDHAQRAELTTAVVKLGEQQRESANWLKDNAAQQQQLLQAVAAAESAATAARQKLAKVTLQVTHEEKLRKVLQTYRTHEVALQRAQKELAEFKAGFTETSDWFASQRALLEKEQAAAADIRAEINSLAGALDLFESGAGACPLCLSKLTDNPVLEAALRARLQTAQEQQQQNKLAQQQRREAMTAYQEKEQTQRALLGEVVRLEQAVETNSWILNETLPEVAATELQAAALREAKEAAANLQRAQDAVTALAYDTIRLRAEGAAAVYAAQRDRLQQLPEYTQNDVAAAQHRLDEHQQLEMLLRNNTATRRELSEAITAERVRISALKEQQEQHDRKTAWAKTVKELRTVFHRDKLPSLVMERVFCDVVTAMNAWLESFGRPFTVEAAPDFSFAVRYPSGDRELDYRLSGGQKVMLAMTYWPAVNALFAGSVGFLTLDEPTAGLDCDKIDSLRSLFEEWRNSAKQEARQTLVVTHDERLDAVFDQVLTLT